MKDWILAVRPKTLPAAVVPVWIGTVLAWKLAGAANLGLAFAALASCLCIQIATNLFNDAIDHRKGADTAKRLGPVRVTASGRLSQRSVLTAAVAVCALAALAGLPLVLERGPVILVIGVVCLALSYGYTGGPVPLAYRGLGELFVILFFGFVATIGSWFVQTGSSAPPAVWLVAFQIGLLSSALIAINNLRDRAEDATTGKRTLAVRFGERFARFEVALFCLLPHLLQPFVWGGRWPVAWVPLLALPLAWRIVRGVWRHPPGPAHNRLLALAGLHLVLWAALLTIGLVL